MTRDDRLRVDRAGALRADLGPPMSDLDVALAAVHHTAMRAAELGATSDQLDTIVRRALQAARPHRYTTDPKNRPPR